MPTRQQVLATAASKIGTVDSTGAFAWREVYPPWVGAAWCAAFVCWVDKQLGIPSSQWVAPGVSGCFYTPSIVAAAKRNGTWIPASQHYRARPGDRTLFDWEPGTGADHIGILEKDLGGGFIQTIEGNTSSGNFGSQSNGRGVWRRRRSLANVMGFVQHTGVDGSASASPAQDLAHFLSPHDVQKLQTVIGTTADGVAGPLTVKALEKKAGMTEDGRLDTPSATVRKLQRYLNQFVGKARWCTYTRLAEDGVLGTQTARALSNYLNSGRGALTGLDRVKL